jgi:hypothetical protein
MTDIELDDTGMPKKKIIIKRNHVLVFNLPGVPGRIGWRTR